MNEEQLSLLDELDEMLVNNDNVVTASADIKVIKDEPLDVSINQDTLEKTFKDNIMNYLKEYEETTDDKVKLENEISEIEDKIREAVPELYAKLDILNVNLDEKNKKLKAISSACVDDFRSAVALNEDMKTLVYNKVQGTYVYPTKKHQFDLKAFIEDNKEFYTENLSILDPYSKITDVADYVKITVKKGK